MAVNPRRGADWLQSILTGLLLFAVGYGTNAITGGIKSVSDKQNEQGVQLVRLETLVAVGMGDRFTGVQGEALDARVVILEGVVGTHEGRLDALDRFCAGIKGP